MRKFFTPLAVWLLTSATSYAAPVLFTDRALFEAALNPDVHSTLDSLVPTGEAYCNGLNDLCSGLVDGVLKIGSSGTGGQSWIGDGQFSWTPFYVIPWISSEQPFTAIGFDLILPNANPLQWIAFSPAAVGSAEFSPDNVMRAPMSSFMGLLYDNPVSTVWLNTNAPAAPVIDGVSVRTVPEPATILLLMAGTALLLRRKR